MPKVEIFCTPFCPYCIRAKKLLDSKNVEYEEIRIDLEPARQDEMVARAKRTSVPQIFIDDYHVGGCDDLFELEAEGTLDSRLGL
ncbi:MAG: glutaredoxin 3 [Gammaproteobacteria bacterium]|nr:glutaredoxin 3 [Gammaproteobacteria bacterium]MCW8986719.1 glutaredoxin 3 [Gammaproteobacteria bacterium]MCW9032424.1 glutaredoxin 3 [Gammaproteobacteria bacterium]